MRRARVGSEEGKWSGKSREERGIGEVGEKKSGGGGSGSGGGGGLWLGNEGGWVQEMKV